MAAAGCWVLLAAAGSFFLINSLQVQLVDHLVCFQKDLAQFCSLVSPVAAQNNTLRADA